MGTDETQIKKRRDAEDAEMRREKPIASHKGRKEKDFYTDFMDHFQVQPHLGQTSWLVSRTVPHLRH